MNFYSLVGKASPGPFSYDYKSAKAAREESPGTDGGGSTGFVRNGTTGITGNRVMAFMAINRDPEQDPRHLADVQLLAHCRQHFMSALDGLKRARRSMCCQCSCVKECGHEHNCEIAIADRLIAKLEEVE